MIKELQEEKLPSFFGMWLSEDVVLGVAAASTCPVETRSLRTSGEVIAFNLELKVKLNRKMIVFALLNTIW